MGFDLASITAAGIGATLSSVGGLATSLREAIVGKELDPNVAAQIEVKLKEMEDQLLIGQMQINLEEAKSEHWFVASWRPFIGWICGVAILYNYVAMPLLVWSVMCWKPEVPAMPALDIGELMALVSAMLGFGYLRTIDKKQDPNTKGKE